MQYKLGCIPDVPDHRDLKFLSVTTPVVFPPFIDLSDHMPAVYDQGQLGSCTANAIGAAFEYELMKQGLKDWMPSRLMIYYLERVLEGTINSDAGAQIRDGIKAISTTGVCQERLWPYIISQFESKPPAVCYSNAQKLHHHALKYRRVNNIMQDIKTSLFNKNPVVIGFVVYQSFYDIGSDGMMPLPQPFERAEGGHAVLAVGYDDNLNRLKIRNSWGRDWGDKGHFYMPYSYVQNPDYAFDFWNISKV